MYLTDLKNQIENLRLLIASVESDLAQKQEHTLAAASTEAWLMALRKNLSDVGRDTEEAFENRRELAKLLVEKIDVSRSEDGSAKVEITYRFGPPAESEVNSVSGERNSVRLGTAHPGRQTLGLRKSGRA